jgi:hypothetical protein
MYDSVQGSKIAYHRASGTGAKEIKMFTTARIEQNGQISSVVRFNSLVQAKEWAPINGHVVVKGYAAQKSIKSGAPLRCIRPDGRVCF